MVKRSPIEIWDSHPPIDERGIFVFESSKPSTLDKDTLNELRYEKEDLEQKINSKFTGKDNDLINLTGYTSNGQSVMMDVQPGKFRYHIILNKTNEIEGGKKIANESNMLVLTAMAMTYTSDGKVIFVERSKDSFSKGNYTLAPGGYMELSDKEKTLPDETMLSPRLTITREFGEEILGKEKLQDLSHIIGPTKNVGLVYSDDVNRGFTLAYIQNANCTSKDLVDIYNDGHDSETKRIIPVNFNEVKDFLQDKYVNMSNNGLGVLLISGRRVQPSGEEWYKDLLLDIKKNYSDVVFTKSASSGLVRDTLKDRNY